MRVFSVLLLLDLSGLFDPDGIRNSEETASPFCGEPPNCPFTVMFTVPAKLNFVRIDPDLELNRIRPEEAVQCSAKSRELSA